MGKTSIEPQVDWELRRFTLTITREGHTWTSKAAPLPYEVGTPEEAEEHVAEVARRIARILLTVPV